MSSREEPRVSVCIPTYNYGHFLAGAIESVLGQGFTDFELVVVDNASEDDTSAVAARYDDQRLHYHRNDRNVGLFGNFARCLELATGEFVKFLAADDWLHPAYLREAVALMERHPSAAIVSGPGVFVDGDGVPYAIGTTGVFSDELVPGAAALRAQADFLNVIGMPSNTLLRRDAVEAVGGFDGRFAPAADVHLWGKLLAEHDLAWLRQPRCYLRVHRGKSHDYGLDPSESTFLLWEQLGEDVGPPITPELVQRALDAEAERSLLYVVAHLLAGRPRTARQILSFTGRHVSCARALARFARRLPVLVRAQLARALAARSGRIVVYDPLARLGPPLSRADGAPAADGQLAPPTIVAEASSTARSSVIVSISFLLASAFGGLLALLIALIVGEGPETDGFLAAYAAYLTFLLFGTTLRIALVPLLGSTTDEAAFRRRATETVGRLIVAGTVMSGALVALSPLLGQVLVPGAPNDAQLTATVSVVILAVAAGCQIWASALAAVLAASRRFGVSAALYAGSSAGTVVVAAVLLALFGVVGAAVAVLGSALILVTGHVLYLRRFHLAVSPPWRAALQAATWRLVVRAAAGASVPTAFQIDLSIALAAVSDRAGAVTGYAYGYFIAVTISGVTSSTLGLTTMPQLVAALREREGGVVRRVGVMRDYLNAVSPLSVFLYLPLAAGYASLGHPFLETVLSGSLQPDTIALLWDASRLFVLMALGWAVLAPVTTLALSLEMFGGIAGVSAVVVVVHTVLVTIASSHGPITVAGAHALSGTLLVILALVLVFRGQALRAALPALWRCLPAGAFALVFPALAWVGFDDDVPRAAAGLVLGAALYLGLAIKLWPSVGGRAVQLLLSGT